MQLTNKKKELSIGEKSLPISKYYDIPVYLPGPLEQMILAHPLNPNTVTKAENFTDLLQLEGYTGSDYGYCMMPDGSGYLATYTEFRRSTPEMLNWWFQWVSQHPEHQPEGTGNLRYKIWCPYGHFDHGLRQAPDGNIYPCAQEALDLELEGDSVDRIYMHNLDPRDFGVPQSRINALDQAGASYGISYETFDYPGMHLCMHIMRPRDDGVIENIGREWIGYGIQNGNIVRVPNTPVDEAFLRKVVFHCTTEMIRLDQILPEIYKEYVNQPINAD